MPEVSLVSEVAEVSKKCLKYLKCPKVNECLKHASGGLGVLVDIAAI